MLSLVPLKLALMRDDIERMVPASVEALGGLNVLVNNAGIAGPTAAVEDADPAGKAAAGHYYVYTRRLHVGAAHAPRPSYLRIGRLVSRHRRGDQGGGAGLHRLFRPLPRGRRKAAPHTLDVRIALPELAGTDTAARCEN